VTSPTGAHVAVTSESANDDDPGTVTIYELGRSEPIATIAHTARVNDSGFSSDGRFLATAGSDRAIRVWDVEENRQVSEIRGDAAIDRVRFVRGDRYLEAIFEDGRGRLFLATYRWKVEDLLDQIAARQLRLSDVDWQRFTGSSRPTFSIERQAER
jgi:WD40 repeat protein